MIFCDVFFKQINQQIKRWRMQRVQHSVFENLKNKSVYTDQSKRIVDKQSGFPKFRKVEIQNEFELVDIHGAGKLSQEDIEGYLKQKYQWINTSILNDVFKNMKWQNSLVQKEQFCSKYLARQKKLFHQIKRLNNYSQWAQSLADIYRDSKQFNPSLYVFFQISKVDLYSNQSKIQWMDLQILYEDHENKVSYSVQQCSYEADQPSFEIWMPAQQNQLFIQIKFISPKDNLHIYGRAYIKQQLQNQIKKNTVKILDITLDNQVVGHCYISMRLQQKMELVQSEIKKNKQLETRYKQSLEGKIKEYQYLGFLWGIRHKTHHKISTLDIKWMVLIRTIFIILLGVLGILAHIYGRCQPLSLIMAIMLLRMRLYVILPSQKFILTWITLFGLILDVVWLVFGSNTLSQINFSETIMSSLVTYALIGVKFIFFLYLLFFQKSLQSQ